MKRTNFAKTIFALCIMLLCATNAFASAGNNNLKIIEVAGAGGLSGASYRQDTIVLFNPTQAAITCAKCAIQTHSGTSNTGAWTVYQLPSNISIPAGGYYMIAASSPTLSTYGSLPAIAYDYQLQTIELGTPASTQNILSSTTGTVALTNTQTALTSVTTAPCGSGSQLVDVVGYGSDIATNAATSATTNICYAGSNPAFYDGSSAYGRQLGVTRKNRCIDTFDNANDFVNTGVTYYNSASTPTPCPTGTQLSAVMTATPTNPGVLDTVLLTAAVTKATSPASGTLTVYANFDSVYYGASALQMYDDGTHGDTTAGDGIYSLSTTIPSTTTAGFTYPLNITINDSTGAQYMTSTRLTISTGSFTMTTPTTTGTVSAGGVLTFPITVTAVHGYGGTLALTCTGSPNANSLGVPTSTQCVSTPSELTVANNGTGTFSLAIATGTTKSASLVSYWPLAMLSVLLCTLMAWKLRSRKSLPALMLVAVASFLALTTTACGTNAGIGNTSAAAGTYTYTLTAADETTPTVNNSLTFTITVQ